ncbi:MAG: glycosyltransferase family 8 protein [Puniceicoccales bacterium]|jgi:lipopolysaccharide biosynthesis glycosyltransferase|nr:glycosyltransferase family 8 protein [Puniceicoccales bacterium]
MNKIDIAFCFDENVWTQAGVAIASLFYNSKNSCNYCIYCVVSTGINQFSRRELEIIVKKGDPQSSITFLEANHDFDQSYFDQFTVGMYYRLMLPKLLPHLDKIIYSDVDVIFCENLLEVDQIDLGDNWIAGVKDTFNLSTSKVHKKKKYKLLDDHKYLCSGFLIMNLKALREQNLYNTWIELSKNTSFNSPDQDILNYTCHGKKLPIPLKYAFIPLGEKNYDRCLSENIYSQQEYEEAINRPILIHFAGCKPWKNAVLLSEIWWIHVQMTPFFNIFWLGQMAPYVKSKKKFYILGCIPFLTAKINGIKTKYYLFGFIPIFKIKNKGF